MRVPRHRPGLRGLGRAGGGHGRQVAQQGRRRGVRRAGGHAVQGFGGQHHQPAGAQQRRGLFKRCWCRYGDHAEESVAGARAYARTSESPHSVIASTTALWMKCAVIGATSEPRHSRTSAKQKPSVITGSSMNNE